MSKRLLISFAAYSIWMMVSPVFVFGDASSFEIQREVVQLQADMMQLNKQHLDIQDQELKKAEIEINQEQAPPELQGPSFRVNKFILAGNTIFSDHQLIDLI